MRSSHYMKLEQLYLTLGKNTLIMNTKTKIKERKLVHYSSAALYKFTSPRTSDSKKATGGSVLSSAGTPLSLAILVSLLKAYNGSFAPVPIPNHTTTVTIKPHTPKK